MTQCSCCNTSNSGSNSTHTNGFINLNGVPYLLGDYIDRETFQVVDTSLIKSNITIDQTEAMRAIIDISIDDIGHKSDGTLNILGNTTLISNIQNMIANQRMKLESKLPVLRKGIVIRVNYQLENYKTSIVMRSMVEEMRISERNLFLLINSKNVNDNAIISNFSTSLVSTINEFTTGNSPMILRITSIQLGYEYVKVNPVIPEVTNSIVGYPVQTLNSLEYPDPYANKPTYGMTESDMYQYHRSMQTQHMLGDPYSGNPNNYIIPDSWYAFSRFYHFDDGGRTIILHNDEIYDKATKSILYQCGSVQVNRAFIINPGHRIIWKFSIWKNDLVIMNDTTSICQIMQAPIGAPRYPIQYDSTQTTDTNPCACCQKQSSPLATYMPLQPMVTKCECDPKPTAVDYTQNALLNQLMTTMVELQKKVAQAAGEEYEEKEINLLPTAPETTQEGCNCGCGVSSEVSTTISNLTAMIAALQSQITSLEARQDADEAEPNVVPIQDHEITEAIENANNSTSINGDNADPSNTSTDTDSSTTTEPTDPSGNG